MSVIGIFGGTFDPIHLGHLITAQAVCEIRNLDKIIFIPAFISPHKTDLRPLSGLHRLNMIKLSIEGINYFDLSDIEIKNENISYSVDTLRQLKKKYKKIELIIGYDNIFDFKTWKEPDEILKLAKLVVLKRRAAIEPDYKDKYFKAALFVETPTIEISSSQIRRRISENLPINFLVPEKVNKYILDNHLYKEK
jgi:nicotinate-nucleotide adenylyltransferase